MPNDQATPVVRATKRGKSAFSPGRSVGRFLSALLFGGVAYALVPPAGVPWWVRASLGWDIAALALVTLAWVTILSSDSAETRRRAGQDDPGRRVVFIVALVSSIFSLFCGTVVVRHVKMFTGTAQIAWTVIALAAVALSWLVTHTVYTLRYAHLYYRSGGVHGLQFPGTEPPADIDFAYFAFTIGMTFQVSDVAVCSSKCRRAVLLHGLISFVFNTTIIALALNLIYGLMS